MTSATRKLRQYTAVYTKGRDEWRWVEYARNMREAKRHAGKVVKELKLDKVKK